MTPFFDAECLVSGIRYAHGYYGRQTKNHTQAFEWYQFEWPWVTSNPDFKVTIIQRQIIRYNIELYSQWPTIRKSYDAIFYDLERPLPPVSRSVWVS